MPAKKKKGGKKSGKAAKLAKMTEEERVLYLEQQRIAEEEMKKKKEDMLASYLKDKLTKEEKTTKFNLAKLNHQWRVLMRDMKADILKRETEILSQTFERIVDKKDNVIKALAQDLMEAEEQYAMAHRHHLENIDSLLEIQEKRLATLEQEFQTEKSIIMHEFDSERERLLAQQQRDLTEIQDIIFGMQSNQLEREEEMRNEFQSQRDELKNKNLEEKHALRVQLDLAVDDLWGQFKQALKNYNENTEERKAAFEALRAKDEKAAHEIEVQMRKIQRLQDQINQLRSKMAGNARQNEESNRQLKLDKEEMARHFQELKGQMNKMREENRRELTKLTVESRQALNALADTEQLGEKILKLAENCRKLETEEEKVLPFYSSSLSADERADVEAAVNEPPVEPLAAVMHESKSLENFWKRYNKVLLDKLALEKEKQTATEENLQLRALLKQYLDGISVNDEILSSLNPLLIVNNKSNIRMNVPLNDPRVRRPPAQVVVEGVTEVRQKPISF